MQKSAFYSEFNDNAPAPAYSCGHKTNYHRRWQLSRLCSEWEEVVHCRPYGTGATKIT